MLSKLFAKSCPSFFWRLNRLRGLFGKFLLSLKCLTLRKVIRRAYQSTIGISLSFGIPSHFHDFVFYFYVMSGRKKYLRMFSANLGNDCRSFLRYQSMFCVISGLFNSVLIEPKSLSASSGTSKNFNIRPRLPLV